MACAQSADERPEAPTRGLAHGPAPLLGPPRMGGRYRKLPEADGGRNRTAHVMTRLEPARFGVEKWT